ncbi:MAG: hypothetical protein GJU76_03350 [Gallionella sp.]|jgi:hypothetical protein|nr:hypothetical protein [Gallionella sp.]
MVGKKGGDVAPQRNAEAEAGVLTATAIVLLVSPAAVIWASPMRSWWSPYLLWFVLICSGAWLAHRRSHAD